jgi:serine phosphatase RsbU (regulator of sigma subunit)
VKSLLLDLVQVAGRALGPGERVSALASCLEPEPGFHGVFTCREPRGEVEVHLKAASRGQLDSGELARLLTYELTPGPGERPTPGAPRQLTIEGAVIGGGPALTAALLWEDPEPGAGGNPALLGGLLLSADAELLRDPELYALLQVVQLSLSRERYAARLADFRAGLELVNTLQPPRLEEPDATVLAALGRLRRIVPFDAVAVATATQGERYHIRTLLPPGCPEGFAADVRAEMSEALGLDALAAVDAVVEPEALAGPAPGADHVASHLVLPALGRDGRDCGRVGFFSGDASFFSHHHVRLLGLLAPSIGAALEELEDVEGLSARARELQDEKHRVEAQLGLARRLQAQLLAPCPPTPEGVVVAQCSETSQEVGGDFFAARRLGRYRYAVAVADVSGKGLPAGIVMAHTRGALWASWDSNPAPGAVMKRMNRVVLDSTDDYTFVTLAVLLVDVRKGELEFSCAGHEPVLRAAAFADHVEEYATGDPPLGVVEGHVFREEKIPFGPGDRLLVFTDGITEAVDASGGHFGRARLEAALLEARGPATNWIPSLREGLGSFVGEQPDKV